MRRIVAPVVFAVVACGLTARHGMAQTGEPAPPSAETATGGSSARTSGTTPARSRRRRAGGGRKRMGDQFRARCRRRLRALLLERDRRVARRRRPRRARRAPGRRQPVRMGAGERPDRCPAATPTGRSCCTFPSRSACGRSARRPEAVASRIRAATSCGRRLRSSAGPTPSRSRPSARGPTAIRDSFPSGHASTSFATAMVLQEHFGWKAGVPAFAVAAYTAVSRVAANQHWASDVVFGAAVGLASGRTVTIQLRETRVTVAPLAVPGGGGVLVTALW